MRYVTTGGPHRLIDLLVMNAGTNAIVLQGSGSRAIEVGAPGERPQGKPIRIYPDR